VTSRINQAILVASTLLGSWLGMQAVHEFGHVFGAWLTGGRVSQVVLYPLTISRTDLASNPYPLIVAWAGPSAGVLLPLVVWLAAAKAGMPGAFVLRFFAGFCLLANGLYIGFGSFDRVGDCGEMLKHGSQVWQLWLFGIVTAPLGLWMWHNLGAYFGFGKDANSIRSAVAFGFLAVFVFLAVLGFVVFGE
jgi:Peptidase M50B-like